MQMSCVGVHSGCSFAFDEQVMPAMFFTNKSNPCGYNFRKFYGVICNENNYCNNLRFDQYFFNKRKKRVGPGHSYLSFSWAIFLTMSDSFDSSSTRATLTFWISKA